MDSSKTIVLIWVIALIRGSGGLRAFNEAWPAVASPTDLRNEYMDSKLAIDRAVLKNFHGKDWPTPDETVKEKKVAFLFLLMEGIDWENIWDRFFEEESRGKYSIYIHRAKVNDDMDPSLKPRLPLERFDAIEVPWVNQSWCALLGVEVATLYAALQDASNFQFVFISQNSVPLKSFAYVYSQLSLFPTTSKICLAQPPRKGSTTLLQSLLSDRSGHSCAFQDFFRRQSPRTLKHHQWATFSREHAGIIVKKASKGLDIWEKSWRKTHGDGCSDESVPLTTLLHHIEEEGKSTGNTWADMARLGVEHQCLTWVRWRGCFAGTELDLTTPVLDALKLMRLLRTHSVENVQDEWKRTMNGFPHAFDTVVEENYLKALVRQGFMFGRKFKLGCKVHTKRNETLPLDSVLPDLWQTVDERRASTSIWTALSNQGKPVPI